MSSGASRPAPTTTSGSRSARRSCEPASRPCSGAAEEVETFAIASLVIAAAAVLFLVVLVARRTVLARSERRLGRAREQLQPVAIALAHGEPAPLPDRFATRAERDVFADLLARYARRLRGASRVRIANVFERRGEVD